MTKTHQWAPQHKVLTSLVDSFAYLSQKCKIYAMRSARVTVGLA
jgi:hypothetical protein